MTQKALNAAMVYYMFDASNMHRWNDHLRTLDLTELDKQAHKAAIAWILGKCEEDAGNRVDWPALIERCLFSFIQRVALTDLKPQIFHRIEEEKAGEVSEYVLAEFSKRVGGMPDGFTESFRRYLGSPKDTKEDAIIRAAHYLATRWEFITIYDANRSVYGIEDTKDEIDRQVLQHRDLAGVREMMSPDSKLWHFVNIIGQLRFQQRWARTPRIPKTTVLGHSLLVADCAYLADRDAGASAGQVYCDFFTGLFHDLPEVLTKDVITPVKTRVSGLPQLLDGIEGELMNSRIMPLIPEGWRSELEFFACDPFTVSSDPVRDGRRVKACDLLGAWVEALVSIRYGVTSRSLREGVEEIGAKLSAPGYEESIGAGQILEDFRKMDI
ncbi:haloacid dehalogenase [Candidatus Methanomethylophilus sp. 1R26]|uniref:YfbR-like 5'-deoxynucleotidase n=1 Tax=Candidatus Methanomethylophilus sp. 1R26 TaxID=1769296 RepID=UPI000736BD80|nr:YfbR-like 5'-deoxynucleotidase [Candidatus Methanomethylophilus sp. 1R26]KUE73222.1 haloacid dehalogenase [Candidatus Methanomethylophilus sp. 1R26]TQS82636.1 MAG: haloacid dehalogenase [Methanomethylophilus alvi]